FPCGCPPDWNSHHQRSSACGSSASWAGNKIGLEAQHAHANRHDFCNLKSHAPFCQLISTARLIQNAAGTQRNANQNPGARMVENLSRQRVLNFLDVFYAGDIEAALACCSDDVEFFANAPIDILPHMGLHKGKAALRAMWQTVHTRYSSMRYEVPIIIAESDKVAANIRVFFEKASN